MTSPVAKRIIAALQECPCCADKAQKIREVASLNAEYVLVAFSCGALIHADTSLDAWHWPNPCPNEPADPRLMDIAEAVALEMRDAS